MDFIDEIRRSYRQGSMLLKIIFINIAVFVLLHIAGIVAMLCNADAHGWIAWVELPSDLSLLVRRPWTLVTYMFSHYNLLHILFNMLWLYWLGRIFMEFFSSKQLSALYLMGGWGGAALFLLAYNLLPYFGGSSFFLIGASASVIAIVVATAVYTPDYKIGLLFFGEVSIKWIAIVTVAIDLLGMEAGNLGTGAAHIGGALVGLWYGVSIKRGRDITRPLNAAIDAAVGLFNGRSVKRPEINWKSSSARGAKQPGQARRGSMPSDSVSEEELDRILKKIKDAGYDALTDQERNKLFKASRQRKP